MPRNLRASKPIRNVANVAPIIISTFVMAFLLMFVPDKTAVKIPAMNDIAEAINMAIKTVINGLIPKIYAMKNGTTAGVAPTM